MAIDLAEVTGAKAAAEAKKKEAPKIANGLDKDAFMKLFLEQLKNQDPTAPMETDKIITQTAQLTQVEMQEENKKTMKEVAEAMKSTKETNDALKGFQGDLKKTLEKMDKGIDENINSNAYLAQVSALNAVSMIGKVVETDVNGVNIGGQGEVNFALYFDEPIKENAGKASIQIFDKDKHLVKTIPIEGKDGQSGYIAFKWDGLDDKGQRVGEGTYDIRAEYNLNSSTNQYHQARVGRGEVESVVFDKGRPMIKMGPMILPMDSAIEFYDKQKGDARDMTLAQMQNEAARINAQNEMTQKMEASQQEAQKDAQGKGMEEGQNLDKGAISSKEAISQAGEEAQQPKEAISQTKEEISQAREATPQSHEENAAKEQEDKSGINFASSDRKGQDQTFSLDSAMPLDRESAEG